MHWKNEGLKCPHCRSVRLRKEGIVGGKQRYYCKRCKKTTVTLKGKV
ncbi:hypothetical protein LCGC14_0539900 [marine sediment metagenome]|uniref:InsA N-terminal domain-containing protein n=1 Tax=marine sediment metagenome TaxID=412755 RepID=A0A0F9V1B4_9ZZZZ